MENDRYGPAATLADPATLDPEVQLYGKRRWSAFDAVSRRIGASITTYAWPVLASSPIRARSA